METRDTSNTFTVKEAEPSQYKPKIYTVGNAMAWVDILDAMEKDMNDAVARHGKKHAGEYYSWVKVGKHLVKVVPLWASYADGETVRGFQVRDPDDRGEPLQNLIAKTRKVNPANVATALITPMDTDVTENEAVAAAEAGLSEAWYGGRTATIAAGIALDYVANRKDKKVVDYYPGSGKDGSAELAARQAAWEREWHAVKQVINPSELQGQMVELDWPGDKQISAPAWVLQKIAEDGRLKGDLLRTMQVEKWAKLYPEDKRDLLKAWMQSIIARANMREAKRGEAGENQVKRMSSKERSAAVIEYLQTYGTKKRVFRGRERSPVRSSKRDGQSFRGQELKATLKDNSSVGVEQQTAFSQQQNPQPSSPSLRNVRIPLNVVNSNNNRGGDGGTRVHTVSGGVQSNQQVHSPLKRGRSDQPGGSGNSKRQKRRSSSR